MEELTEGHLVERSRWSNGKSTSSFYLVIRALTDIRQAIIVSGTKARAIIGAVIC